MQIRPGFFIVGLFSVKKVTWTFLGPRSERKPQTLKRRIRDDMQIQGRLFIVVSRAKGEMNYRLSPGQKIEMNYNVPQILQELWRPKNSTKNQLAKRLTVNQNQRSKEGYPSISHGMGCPINQNISNQRQ
jgi:hypothetical protein